MHDANNRITLPGFYDRVRVLEPEERRELARIPQGEDYYLKETGTLALWGEPDFSPNERTGARPTLEVNGLYSGYIGEGAKTVLPAYAMAKISMRLVPDQHPDEVHQQLLQYMKVHAPRTIRYEVKPLAGSPASISDRKSRGVQALSKAMETVWGKPPIFKREGGSVPVVNLFQDILGIESVNTGFSMAGDNMHSPNEKLHLPTWQLGTQALVHFLYNLAEV
jgi:acetylornithine deacetylase/succinyl-diaminopimelate desuccinylase-like protein